MQKFKLAEILQTAREAASAASIEIVKIRRESNIDIAFKSETDLVTNADLKAEEIIIQHIKKSFPDHGFLTEESHPKIDATSAYNNPLWIIDPIDGTANYAHGLPNVAVSIAFADQGKVLAGIVQAPFQSEIFEACLNQGALLNKQAIHCKKVENLKLAMIATGFAARSRGVKRMVAQVTAVLENCRDIRRFGSAAIDICWVACGRIDGYWEKINPWDFAAAALIAREAGVMTGSIRPQPNTDKIPADLYADEFLAACPELYPKLKALLDIEQG